MMTPRSTFIDRRSLLRRTVTIAGAAVVLPSLASLTACQVSPAGLSDQMELIAALSDRIIPQTTTPGALAAGVPDYIAAVFEQHFTPVQQREFLDNLSVFDSLAKRAKINNFASASAEDQDAILQEIDNGDADQTGKASFNQIRDMVIFGYYTSEAATQELAYEEYPGRFDGCVPLAEIGSAWLERGV